MIEELYAEPDGSVTEEKAARYLQDLQEALEETPEIVKESIDCLIDRQKRHHPIVSFDHYKVGEGRQGIIVDAECPETGARLTFSYGPENENVGRCECGEFITLGTCRPIQDAKLSDYELDIAERNEEKRQAVAETLGIDPDRLGTKFQDRIPERFDTDRLCECSSSPPGVVSSKDPRFCGYCGGVLGIAAEEFGLSGAEEGGEAGE